VVCNSLSSTGMAPTSGLGYRRAMSESDLSLRDQLLEAQANIRRQIEILAAGPASLVPGGQFLDNSHAIAELQATLRDIEDGLANLATDSARQT